MEDDGAGHVLEEGVNGDMPARIAEMEAEMRTLREANKSESPIFEIKVLSLIVQGSTKTTRSCRRRC